jgi:hypothetical protein
MKHKIFKADRDEEAKHFTIFYKGKKITTATELKCLIIPNETQFWEERDVVAELKQSWVFFKHTLKEIWKK